MALFTSRRQKQDIKLNFQNDMLFIERPDGTQQTYPLAWLPALKNATDEERADWQQTENGIHWNSLNIDISY